MCVNTNGSRMITIKGLALVDLHYCQVSLCNPVRLANGITVVSKFVQFLEICMAGNWADQNYEELWYIKLSNLFLHPHCLNQASSSTPISALLSSSQLEKWLSNMIWSLLVSTLLASVPLVRGSSSKGSISHPWPSIPDPDVYSAPTGPLYVYPIAINTGLTKTLAVQQKVPKMRFSAIGDIFSRMLTKRDLSS